MTLETRDEVVAVIETASAAEEFDSPAKEGRSRARDLAWTMFGKLAMTGANSLLLLSLIPLGLLDLETFGLFGTCIALQLVLSRVVLVGADQGMIRLYTVEDLRSRPQRVVAAGLHSALLFSIPAFVLGAIGVFAAEPVARAVGIDPWPSSAVLAVPLGAVGLALFDYAVAARLARLRYRRAALVQASMPIVRTAVTLGALYFLPTHPGLSFLLYAIVSFAFGAYLSFRTWGQCGRRPERALIVRLLSYAKWLGAADVAMIVCLQVGLFLLTYLDLGGERGTFVFSLNLFYGWFAVFLAFYQTILPRAARIADVADLPGFIFRWLRIGGAIGVGCLVLAPAIAYGIEFALSPIELPPFIPSFFALTGFAVVLVLEAPLTVACQYLLLPQLPVLNLVLRIVIVAALGLWLAPRYGALGAGLAQLAGAVVSYVLLASFLTAVVRARQREA